MRLIYGKKYVNKAFCSPGDSASGSSDDNGYIALGIKYSLTFELRDTGYHGFILPADQIVPQGEELVKGMVALYKYAARNPYKK